MSVTSNEVRKNLKQQQDEEEQSNYSFRLGYLQLQYLQIKSILRQKGILNQLFDWFQIDLKWPKEPFRLIPNILVHFEILS